MTQTTNQLTLHFIYVWPLIQDLKIEEGSVRRAQCSRKQIEVTGLKGLNANANYFSLLNRDSSINHRGKYALYQTIAL